MSKFTITLLQFLIFYHTTLSKEIPKATFDSISSSLEDLIIESDINGLLLTPYTAHKSLISDLWKGAKQSAVNIWHSIKSLVSNSKDKIKIWTENVKSQAIHSSKVVEERLKNLKTTINQIIQNVVGVGENVKKCLKKENENIDIIVKKITKQVTKCISDKLGTLKTLEDDYMSLQLNEYENNTDFISNVETKLNGCLQNEENQEVCFQNVRREILEEADAMENVILNEREVTRQKTDDILEAIVKCSTQGLIDAAALIAAEVVEIMKCVIKG